MIHFIKRLEEEASLSKQQILKIIEIIKDFNNPDEKYIDWNELHEILLNTSINNNEKKNTKSYTEQYF